LKKTINSGKLHKNIISGVFMKFFEPKNYKEHLSTIDTQVAIKLVKDNFEKLLAKELHLTRVSAPLFVLNNSGLNDNLNGIENPVSFTIKDIPDEPVEIVHSLAKWKRMALAKYGLSPTQGLYTDMNAIRKDEELDNTHSIYVDQWDWELIIKKENRNLDFLKNIVNRIWLVLKKIEEIILERFPALPPQLPENIIFITSQELEDKYPNLTPSEREAEATKEHKAIFVMQVGKKLLSGIRHDKRAPDYDDWELNGDIIVWSHVLEMPIELSSMGIRVDENALKYQLEELKVTDRLNLDFHKKLMDNKLPLTIGGGIGQSRICMFFLQKAHIGQVHASLWDNETIELCKKANIILL